VKVLDATVALRASNYESVQRLAEAAASADPENAEAWFLQGLVADLRRNLPVAEQNYRKAAQAAPQSPEYSNNLARALLEQGKFDESINEYRKISDFPLAFVERALAHWAKSEFGPAKDAQRDALKMLSDTNLEKNFYNRREWVFRLEDTGVALGPVMDKRCYVELEEAATRRLAGDASVDFPPKTCADPRHELRLLVAHDLCRFVPSALKEKADALREGLAQTDDCPRLKFESARNTL
jgi:tetratricopeptide (TPR) repeat protein